MNVLFMRDRCRLTVAVLSNHGMEMVCFKNPTIGCGNCETLKDVCIWACYILQYHALTNH